MADEDDIKPDAPETEAASGDVVGAPGDAPVPREPEAREVVEGAEDAASLQQDASAPEASANPEPVDPPATEAEATAPDAALESDAVAEPPAASEDGDTAPPEVGAEAAESEIGRAHV